MGKREDKYLQMTTQPVRRLVFGFAVPSIVCMLMTSFYNMADTWFVSRLNTQSVAAVGIVFSYMGIIQAVSFFFGHGSGNYISRALGARNSGDAESMAATGLLSALAAGVLIGMLCLMFQNPVLRIFGATDSILPYARKYLHYIIAGTPFISGSIVLNNQMRLQGNARLSMIGILSGGLLNVALDPLFIFTLDMGVAGAGLATALSQFLCFCLMLNLCGRNGGISIRPSQFRPTLKNYKEIAAGGLPSLARQGLMFLSLICLNNTAAGYGDSAVAAFSVVSRVMAIAFALLIGFGQGFQPVCGFNYGAGKYDRVRKALRFTTDAGTVYCLVFALIAFVLAPQIISLFCGGDSEVLSIGSKALRFQCVTFPLCSAVTVSNMFLQNIRKTGPAVLVAVARQGLFFIPAVLIGNLLFSLDGLAAAQSVSDICAFILCLPLLVIEYRKLR
ncbi:MAG: MATE family efflux transporter [Bacteroidales bacterium]|nr:MATE family efflux transporter [Bacteroidales bacterium]